MWRALVTLVIGASLVGYTQPAEATPDLEAAVASVVTTQAASQPTATETPVPTPTATQTPTPTPEPASLPLPIPTPVPETKVRFTGRTSAGTLVAVVAEDKLVGVGLSDSSGRFEQIINVADVPASAFPGAQTQAASAKGTMDQFGAGGIFGASPLDSLSPRISYLQESQVAPSFPDTASIPGQAIMGPITFTLFAQDPLRLVTVPVDLRPTLEAGIVNDAGFVLMPPTVKVLTLSVVTIIPPGKCKMTKQFPPPRGHVIPQ